MTCPECGSEKVIPNSYVRDKGEHSDGKLAAGIQTKPDAWMFKGIVDVELKAAICCDCGWIKIRCEGDLDKLWKAHCDTGAGS